MMIDRVFQLALHKRKLDPYCIVYAIAILCEVPEPILRKIVRTVLAQHSGS